MQQENKKIKKPNRELVEQFKEFGTATISSALREVCGIRRAFMIGPVAFTSGKKAVGTAVTLQFLPKREDIEPGQTEEEQESTSALWSATIEVGNEIPILTSNRQSTDSADAPVIQSITYRTTGVLLTSATFF